MNPELQVHEALGIVHADAVRAYDDLSPYRIEFVLEDDGWHIDCELRETEISCGGRHYVIDASTGEIRPKRYEP
ncbi:MAG: hypothetical protein KF861_20180 [Planctomycetaceae bacterium]|nr:hypothetical protein [Planctomycetaceae bacterium]